MIKSRVLLRDNTTEDINVYTPYDYDTIPLNPYKFIKSKSKKRPSVLIKAISLDTETSHNHDELCPRGWVYQWAFKFDNIYVGGRRPSELLRALDKLLTFYKCDDKHKIVIYIHNASYDLTYLVDIFIEHYGEPTNMLATDVNKYISIEFEKFIVRDSWVLSNRSLDKWSKDLNTTYRKAVGSIDYQFIRFQDSKLEPNDWYYQCSDVATLDDCVRQELKAGYTLQTIPLTSTGFVREYCRKQFHKDNKNWRQFQDTKLDENVYKDLTFAYMGAITHGNNDYMGELLENINMGHRDVRSFYPSTMRLDDYPIGRWTKLYNYTDSRTPCTVNKIRKWERTDCLLISFFIKDITLLRGITCPILQVNKCLIYKDETTTFIKDNGKVVKMTGKTFLTLTDLDFEIMLKQYHIDKLMITRVYGSKKGKLPEWLTNSIDRFMYDKTKYKNEVKRLEQLGDIDALADANINLMKSKNRLNGIYGCTATNPVRTSYVYDSESREWDSITPDISTALEKFYKSRNNFMPFQYGVWVTAHCRRRIIEHIERVGYDRYVYTDTDSLFYLKDEETELAFDKFNSDNLAICKELGAYVEVDGKVVEYMTFEDEEENITDFKFLHTKCYGYCVDNDPNSLKITIAGVPKYYKEDLELPPKERRTRETELGTLDNLADGKVFTHCGGTRAIYTDERPRTVVIKGHKTEIARACIISDTTKTLRELNDVLVYYEDIE